MSGDRIKIGFDLQNALAVQRNLGAIASELPSMQTRAIYALARRLKVAARRDIQREYNIDAARVNRDLSSAVTTGVRGVKLAGYFRGIGLRNFGARSLAASGRGVSASIFRGRRESYPNAFMARGRRSGSVLHVFQRTGGPKKLMVEGVNAGKWKEPIERLFGPTVAQMLRKGQRPERLADFAVGVVGAEIRRQLKYFERDVTLPPINTSTAEDSTP